ncbi:MAG: aldehyde dehydrogenase family protein [Spiribacter salinus]|uniref:Aldehyde dehydrogenase family protein n=1 Tax=Spiribacter salinus TaxID=1335746 RepID=A0A540VPZ0_9GAMM|nr:MAG: aldehyde dehydrogenase family protein [Spiribacter salinus]
MSRFYIDGGWVTPSSDSRFPVLNPAMEKKIGDFHLADAQDVNAAVAAATTSARLTKFRTAVSVIPGQLGHG